jgi:hypothetical protein
MNNGVRTYGDDLQGIIAKRGNVLRTELPEHTRKEAEGDFEG